jgi:hypothetical protein
MEGGRSLIKKWGSALDIGQISWGRLKFFFNRLSLFLGRGKGSGPDIGQFHQTKAHNKRGFRPLYRSLSLCCRLSLSTILVDSWKSKKLTITISSLYQKWIEPKSRLWQVTFTFGVQKATTRYSAFPSFTSAPPSEEHQLRNLYRLDFCKAISSRHTQE